jgi:glutathione S-transferase
MILKMHPEIDGKSGYIGRFNERMEKGLEWIDKELVTGRGFGVPDVALICGLEWFEKRQIVDWRKYPTVAAVYEQHRSRPSLVQTRIPEHL